MGRWSCEAEAREEIKALVADYYHAFKERKQDFQPGDKLNYASRMFDEKEMQALTDTTLDFWLTAGRFAEQFEHQFAEWLGVRFACLVNSGSSANLLAFMALTAPELGERQIRPGDEVITVWQATGYNAIIYIAALSTTDMSLHEAAMIDGASRFQRVLHIDIPSILPTTSIMLVLAVGNIMNVGYEKVLLMQNSLNMNYSEIISTYTYKVGLASGIPNFSQATAIGMFNSVVNFTLLVITNFVSKRLNGSGIF